MSKKLRYQSAKHRHQTARTGKTENLLPLLLSMLNQRETRAELPNLDPQRAIELYEDYRKGIMADVQLAFDEMESYDDDLATVVDKRQRALEQMPWQVEIDSAAVGDDPARQQLANEQQAYLQQRFNAIENLDEAITYLGMADFHGVAALELTGNDTRARWEIIEPWLLARPARRGPWYYNPEASRNYADVEELDPGKVIIREARPISLVAMWLVVAKHHAIHGWDEFLEVFGNPSIFAELPPGTSEENARVLDEMVKRIVSDGRGTVPTGTKFTTVETGQNNCSAFQERARWCKEAIITVATGGQLTVLAEPGSGTLAGGAHSDSFESLCAGSAAAISAVINKQWVRRILAEKWPEQPALARFTLAPEPADERAAMADLLGKLTAAGYELETDEAASDLVTLPLRRIPQQMAAPGMPGAIPALGAPATPQPNQLASIMNREATLTVDEEAPLTEDEMAAFHSLSKPNIQRMNQRRQEVERALLAAADIGEDGGEEGVLENRVGCRRNNHQKGCTCPPPAMQAATQQAQKGGRGSKGNPAGKPNKSNVPSKLPANASDGELETLLRKGLDAADNHEGNQRVSRGVEKYNLTQERADHRRKHKGEGTTNEAIAKTMTQGDFERDGVDATAYHNGTKVIKRNDPKTGGVDVRSAYNEPNYRPRDKKKKNPGQEPGPTDR